MNILMIKSRLPYPPQEGTNIVSFNLIRSLSKWHKITLLSIIRSPEEVKYIQQLEKYCKRVIIVDVQKPRLFIQRIINKVKQKLLFIFLGIPESVTWYCPKTLIKKTTELVKENNFDLIQVEYWHTARVVKDLKNIKTALIHHDVAFLTRELITKRRTIFYLKIFTLLQKVLEKKYEIRTINWFDHNIALTEYDAEIFRREGNRINDFKTLPVWIDDMNMSEKTVQEDIDLVFVGDMSYIANEDAAFYFVKTIWPRIKNEIPGAKFFLVGKHPSAKVKKLNGINGVTVTGFVNDVNEYVNRAKVMVAPLRIGGGIKIKIIEAMSAGKAIVTTSIGYQGINAQKNQDLIVEDDPVLFANKIVMLLRDEKQRMCMGSNARSVFKSDYSREICEEKIKVLYDSVIGYKPN